MSTATLTPEVTRLVNKGRELAQEVREEIAVLESQRNDLDAQIKELRAMVRVWDPQPRRPRVQRTTHHSGTEPSPKMAARVAAAILALPEGAHFTTAEIPTTVGARPSINVTLKFFRERTQFLGVVRQQKNHAFVYRVMDREALEQVARGQDAVT